MMNIRMIFIYRIQFKSVYIFCYISQRLRHNFETKDILIHHRGK